MSATAFKNAARRREHRERHQPAARQGLGLLEKHKDYVVRARNFHAKEARIGQLRAKAANRNPDEFYFGMLAGSTKGGIASKRRGADSAGGSGDAGARPDGALSAEMLAVLKTQDAGYVRTMQSAEEHKVARLRATLHGSGGGRHTVFADDDDDDDDKGEAGAFDEGASAPAVGNGTWAGRAGQRRPREPENVDNDFTATTTSLAADHAAGQRKRRRGVEGGAEATGGSGSVGAASLSTDAFDADPKRRKRAAKEARALVKAKARSYAELDARTARVRKLAALGLHMDVKRRLLTSKGRRTKVADAQGDLPAVYRWKPKRQR